MAQSNSKEYAGPPGFRGGYEAFLDDAVKASGGRRTSGRSSRAGAYYTSGPLKGLTQGQGERMMRQKYAVMPDQARKPWESVASMSDVRSAREMAAQAQNNANANTSANGEGDASDVTGAGVPAGMRPGQQKQATQSGQGRAGRIEGGAAATGIKGGPTYMATNGGSFTSEAEIENFLNSGTPPAASSSSTSAAYAPAPRLAPAAEPAASSAPSGDGYAPFKDGYNPDTAPLWTGLGPVEDPRTGATATSAPVPAPVKPPSSSDWSVNSATAPQQRSLTRSIPPAIPEMPSSRNWSVNSTEAPRLRSLARSLPGAKPDMPSSKDWSVNASESFEPRTLGRSVAQPPAIQPGSDSAPVDQNKVAAYTGPSTTTPPGLETPEQKARRMKQTAVARP